MSKSLQEIFERLQDRRKQANVIRAKYKEELSTSVEYEKIKTDMEKLRGKKKQYEASVKEQAGANFARADELTLAIKQDVQMLSDIALTSIMKGESVKIQDANAEYEPVFSVRFRKMK